MLTLDFFEIVTYITEYYSKDESGIIEYLKRAEKDMVDMNMQKKFREMANVFLSHRRIGEPASLYRIIPDMHLSESNVKCVYVVQLDSPTNAITLPRRYLMTKMIHDMPKMNL